MTRKPTRRNCRPLLRLRFADHPGTFVKQPRQGRGRLKTTKALISVCFDLIFSMFQASEVLLSRVAGLRRVGELHRVVPPERRRNVAVEHDEESRGNPVKNLRCPNVELLGLISEGALAGRGQALVSSGDRVMERNQVDLAQADQRNALKRVLNPLPLTLYLSPAPIIRPMSNTISPATI